LRQPSPVKDPIKGDRELDLRLFLSGVLELKVGEDVPRARADSQIIFFSSLHGCCLANVASSSPDDLKGHGFHRLRKKLQFANHVPPAKAGSGGKINGLSARLKSCPDTKQFTADFFRSRFQPSVPSRLERAVEPLSQF
jgi:hypothetical protein